MVVGGDCCASVMHRESSGASMAAGGHQRRRKAAETGGRSRIIARARPYYFKLKIVASPANAWYRMDSSMPRMTETAPFARIGTHRWVYQLDKVPAPTRLLS